MSSDGLYEKRSTQLPPTLVERDGHFFISVSDGLLTLEAPVGVWFCHQIFDRVFMPLLLDKSEERK